MKIAVDITSKNSGEKKTFAENFDDKSKTVICS